MTDEYVQVDEKQLRRLQAALDAEATGKQLDQDLVDGLRAVAAPARAAVRAAILSSPSRSDVMPSIRTVIADAVEIVVHRGGQHPGVGIRVGKDGMPRDFPNAPKRFNDPSFRHRVFGRDVWVRQVGAPGWFDTTLIPFQAAANHVAGDASDGMARRIDARTRG